MENQGLTPEQFFAKLFREEDYRDARSQAAASRQRFGSKEYYACLFGNGPGCGPDEMAESGTCGFNPAAPAHGRPEASDGAVVQFPDTDLLRITIKRDSEGRILRKIETETHGGSKTTYDYVYDDAGRLALVLRNGMETERYEYDKAGRRIAGTSEAFGMRPVTLEYDGMRLTRCGDTTYGYAADGTLRDRHDSGGTTWFLYAGDTGLDGAVLPDGRTFSWQANGTTGQPLVKHEGDTPVERYRWRDLVRLERHDDLRRGTSQHYHYAEGSRLPHAMTEYQGGQSASYTLGYDQVGTLKAVADMDGKLVKQRQYDSFGNLLNDTTPNWFIPIGFAGGVHDRDTGLVRFGRRDYDPQCGRFVAQDPLGDTGGDHDLYEYCVDDPVNLIDPNGLKWLGAFTSAIRRGIGKMAAMFNFTDSAGKAIQDINEIQSRGQNATRNISADPEGAYHELEKVSDDYLKFYEHKLHHVVKDGAKAVYK